MKKRNGSASNGVWSVDEIVIELPPVQMPSDLDSKFEIIAYDKDGTINEGGSLKLGETIEITINRNGFNHWTSMTSEFFKNLQNLKRLEKFIW